MDHLQLVELADRIRLGMNCLLGCLDASQRHLPYWNCGFSGGDVTQLKHAGPEDRYHNVGRALHGLSIASAATGEVVDGQVLSDLADHEIALFDQRDDLPGASKAKDSKRTVRLHDVRENLHGLTALIKLGDKRAGPLARRMIRRLLGGGDGPEALSLDHLPTYLEDRTWAPHGGGRTVDALVRYYRACGDEAALDLAGRICSHALRCCFTSEGTLTERAGVHGHSINALLAGMVDFGLLTRDGSLLSMAKAIYDVGLPRFNSSFGWSMESLTRFTLRGESNNTGDLLRAALLLGRAGWPEYFGAAERILRSHLLPSQVVDVDRFSDDARAPQDHLRSIASRIRGGFSFPTPNDYLAAPDAPIVTYDITSGAVDGLCEALQAAVSQDEAAARVNLLISRETGGVAVRSELSSRGQLEIENATGRNLFVRLPGWVSAQEVQVRAGGVAVSTAVINGYLVIPSCHKNCDINFAMRDCRIEESISYHNFTIDWRGDQIVAMSPPGEHLPMFPPCGT